MEHFISALEDEVRYERSFHFVLICLQIPRMNESLIVTLMYLFNQPKYRCFVRRGVGMEVRKQLIYVLLVLCVYIVH